jgi:hypothetical protein
MNYDIEKYFGAGHWISRDGKIEVPLKSAEHAEVASDIIEKYYNDEFIDMDPGLSLSDYSDFLLDKGWIVHRESNFLSNRLDNTTKDTIFIFAKKHNLEKITVETPKKVKLIEEPPEMIYEQRNYQRYFAWIDTDGKTHKCDPGQIHDSWAHDYMLKNHRLMWNVLKSDNVDDSRVFTEYLLERGWIRQSDCSFETSSMRKSVCWNIYEAAKSAGCNSVFVDHHGKIVEGSLEKFIEENG